MHRGERAVEIVGRRQRTLFLIAEQPRQPEAMQRRQGGPLAQLPPAPGTVTPATTTPAAAPLGTPDLLAGAVVFVGPSADPSAATSMSALGAHVVEVATDPTTAQGAEIIGAAAAIARQLT